MSPLSAKEKYPLLLSKAFTELNLKGDTLIFRQILNTLTPKRKCPLPLLGKFEYYYLREEKWLNPQNYISKQENEL